MIKKIIGWIRGLIQGNIKSISVFHNVEDTEKVNNFKTVLRRIYTDTTPIRLVTVRRYTLRKKNYTLERDTFLITYVFSGNFFGRATVITELLQYTPPPVK